MVSCRSRHVTCDLTLRPILPRLDLTSDLVRRQPAPTIDADTMPSGRLTAGTVHAIYRQASRFVPGEEPRYAFFAD